MNNYRYVSSEIREEYKKWTYWDTIFITAPTGRGKSHFILHDLLEYVIDNPRQVIQNGIYKYEKNIVFSKP